MTPVPGPFAALRRFVRPRPPVERCELCAKVLGEEHPHLLELAGRRIACSCEPCALLFENQESSRFRRIPRDGRRLPEFRLGDDLWDQLGLPINLAFLFHHSGAGKVVAMYPSPAGATEAKLPLEAWPRLVEQNPSLRNMRPDVEALLLNRIGAARDYFIAPIDECFRLVGQIREHWRGLSGGADVWRAVDAFFVRLRERSLPGGEGPCPT
jgi:hypothetical protein